jgi:hypothetical protein
MRAQLPRHRPRGHPMLPRIPTLQNEAKLSFAILPCHQRGQPSKNGVACLPSHKGAAICELFPPGRNAGRADGTTGAAQGTGDATVFTHFRGVLRELR